MRKILVALGLFCVVGCSSDGPAAPLVDATGTFKLTTVNGSPIPYTLATGTDGSTEVLVQDVYTFSIDHTYVDSATITVNPVVGTPTTTVVPEAGTWSVTGYTLHVTDNVNGYKYTALIDESATVMSQFQDQGTFVFTKVQ